VRMACMLGKQKVRFNFKKEGSISKRSISSNQDESGECVGRGRGSKGIQGISKGSQ
jgi:hypothetical protein